MTTISWRMKKGEKAQESSLSLSLGPYVSFTLFSTLFLLIKFSYNFNSYIDDGCLSTAHIQCISHAKWQNMMGLWVEKDKGDATNSEYTQPLVLCHVTNEYKAAFQLKRRLSSLFQENPKTVRLSCIGRPHPMDWPCWMTKMVSTPHPLSYASSLTHPRWCFNPDATSPIFKKSGVSFPRH